MPETKPKGIARCPKCGHPNHKSRMHQDVCTFYVSAIAAECGCEYSQAGIDGRLNEAAPTTPCSSNRISSSSCNRRAREAAAREGLCP
jgi:hypothetical protein